MPDTALETRGLTKAFGGFRAVRGLDLKVRRHSIHALIGPNGAGKTTVFNLLTKVHVPTDGQILYEGHDITRDRRRRSPGAGWCARSRSRRSSRTSRCATTSGWRSSAGSARSTGSGARAARSRCSTRRRCGSSPRSGWRTPPRRAAADLSYGRKRTLEIATTLALDPPFLLLDEPTQGMAIEDVDRIKRLIRRIAKGRTILMVEHNMSVVADLCDTITVLQRGEILAEGPYAAVSADPAVKAAYLGGGHA